jgi:hypothetical protein
METDIYFNQLKDHNIQWVPSTKEKKPAIDWKPYQTTRPTDEEYSKWMAAIKEGKYDGIQIINGQVSNNIFTFDFDSKDKNLIKALLNQDLSSIISETLVSETPHGYHIHYFAENGVEVLSTQFSNIKVDIKGEKSLSKEYPSQNYINISNPDKISTMPKEEVDKLLSKFKLLDKNWKFIHPIIENWTLGHRQLLALASAGFLRKKLDFDIKKATEIIGFICRFTNDEEASERFKAIQQTYSRPVDETAIHSWLEKAGLEELDKQLYSLIKSSQKDENTDKIWIELPGPNRPVSVFVSEIADYYAKKEKLFYRINTDEIVRVGPIDIDNKKTRVLGLIPLDAESLITFLESDFAFYSIERYDNKVIKSIGPSLAKIILSSLDQFKTRLPVIKRLFSVPIPYLIDQELKFPKRGYDPEFMSFMPFDTPEIDPNMSLEKTKETLNFVYSEFAFVNDEDRVNAISHLLTPFCRGLFQSETARSPLFVYMANRERAGKDYCANIVSIVYENQAVEDTAISKDGSSDEEFRKKIFAVLSSGRSVFHSSNNRGFLNSAELEGLITREFHRDRKLGANVEFTFPNTLTLSISANSGLTYTPDLQYRSIFINLFLDVEDPNQRTFKNPNLHGWVKEHRSDIISALYTLVRNWYENGMPKCSKPFASFPQWMEVVGGILEAAEIGIPQQNDTLNSIGGNREEEAMKAFYEEASKIWSKDWVEKAEIFNTIENKDLEGMHPKEAFEPIFEFLTWNKNPTSARMRFGRMLSKYSGRILSNIRMIEDKPSHSTRARYRFLHQEEDSGYFGHFGYSYNPVKSTDIEKEERIKKVSKVAEVANRLNETLESLPNPLSTAKNPVQPGHESNYFPEIGEPI